MATHGWRTNSTLSELLFARFGRFNVFQLVRLLNRKQRGADGTAGPVWELGYRFRFRADLSTAFPGQEIARLRRVPGRPHATPERAARLHQDAPIAETIELTTPNYCVAGILGPLPGPFADWVRDQARNREYAMQDFFDIFNQRLNVLRFDLKTRQTPGLNSLPPEETAIARHLASLMGLGQLLVAAQVPLAPRTWLALAGLLSNTRKSAPALALVLTRYLGAAVGVTQLRGAWAGIEPEDRMALGRVNSRLGQQSVLGTQVWDQQARLLLDVAPLPYARFCDFLPGSTEQQASDRGAGAHHADFVTLLRMMVDNQCDVEVRLQVSTASLPSTLLTAHPDPAEGGYRGQRLGQTAWLARASGATPAPVANAISYLVERSA